MASPQAAQAVVFREGDVVGDYSLLGGSAAGGMGRVYCAVHVATGRRVAIKTVTSVDDASVAYFESEMAALLALDHPGVVPIREHGVIDGQPWYAMDWIEGPTLRSLLQASFQSVAAQDTKPADHAEASTTARLGLASSAVLLRPLQRQELVHVCAQLLQVMGHVHSKGVVHGDLKPENIFVLPGPRPMLVDFGVCHSFREKESLGPVPRAVGSAAYMAPEQVRGALLDGRADLYALGCVLYECLTGFNPFQRPTTAATLLAQLNHHPDPPSSHVVDIPPALDGLVLRLLSKHVADRPRYATDALAMLASQGIMVSHEEEEAPRQSRQQLYRSALFGRQSELLLLREAVSHVQAGRSFVLFVQGEIGVGKTRLLLEAIDLASRAQLRVFCIRCGHGEGEKRAPHDPASELYPVWRALRSSEVDDSRLGTSSVSSIDSFVQDLMAAACEQPLLIAVDDFDRSEELTRTVVERLRRVQGSPEARFMLLCTTSQRLDAEPAPATQVLRLGRLSRADVERSVCSMLGTEYASPRLVESLHERCDGNPLMLSQFLRLLLENDSLVHTRHSGWHLQTSAPPPLVGALSEQADRELLRQRIAKLSPQERVVVDAASALGRTFASATLLRLCPLEAGVALTALQRLVETDIIQDALSGLYRFSHPLLRELLYVELSEEQVIAFHALAARDLAEHPSGGPADLVAIARHLKHSGQHLEAAARYEAAGLAYRDNQSFQLAYNALTSATEELKRCRERPEVAASEARIYEALGDTALLLRQLEAAERAFLTAGEHLGQALEARARLHRKLAAASQRDHDKAVAHLNDAIRLLAGGDEPTSHSEWLQAHLDLMFIYYWKRDPARVLALGGQIEHLLLEHGSPEQRAGYSFNVAAGLMALHRYVTGPEELALIDRALEIYTQRGDKLKASMAGFLRGMILLFGDRLEQSIDSFVSLLAIGQKTSSFTIQVRALAYLCLSHRRRRDVEALRRVASPTLGMAREHDMPEYQGIALANLSWLAHGDGDLAECERLARSAMTCWNAAGTKTAFMWTASLPLMAALSRGGPQAEAECVSLAAALLDPSQQQLPPPLEVALRALGRADAAVSSSAASVIQIARRCCFM